MPLEGKKITLTGGAGGIGGQVARSLMDRGAELTIVDRVEELNFDADYVRGDLSTPDGIDQVAMALQTRPVDILINLAGIQYFGPLADQSAAHVVTSYNVNLLAPVLLTKAVLPGMKANGAGHIVNVGSIFGSINYGHFVTYSSAKAGLRGFSEALRRECRPAGIGVTYIAPRAVKTPLNAPSVLRFAELTKMNMDDPGLVARRIVNAIVDKKKDVYIGFPESLFVRINAVAPRLVDAALARPNRLAAKLFSC